MAAENPREIPTIATRVVLTEKIPFWVDSYHEDGQYFATLLVKACTNQEEVNYKDNLGDTEKRNIPDYYIIVKGTYESLLLYKKDCKRIMK